MIIGVHIEKPILYAPERHIAFPISAEGHIVDVASQVRKGCWPELAQVGQKNLGCALHHKVGEKMLHALVCHTFEPKGWERTAEYLEIGLDLFLVSANEPVAISMVGYGIAPQRHIDEILSVMAASSKRLNVYLPY